MKSVLVISDLTNGRSTTVRRMYILRRERERDRAISFDHCISFFFLLLITIYDTTRSTFLSLLILVAIDFQDESSKFIRKRGSRVYREWKRRRSPACDQKIFGGNFAVGITRKSISRGTI